LAQVPSKFKKPKNEFGKEEGGELITMNKAPQEIETKLFNQQAPGKVINEKVSVYEMPSNRRNTNINGG
jgi:hypothetical protein